MQSLHAEVLIVFPPFPPIPPDVKITPYKEFEEHGIRVEKDGNGQEVDGVGIPTAILPIYQEPDFDVEWDSEPFHRPAPPRDDRRCWWEEWSEQDNKRVPIAFHPQQRELDRIHSALSCFRGSRRWPSEQNGKIGPKYFWNQFCIFIGAIGYPPVWNRTDKPKSKDEEPELISPDYSDQETDQKSSGPPASTATHVSIDPVWEPKRRAGGFSRPPYAHCNVKPINVGSDEAVRQLLELDRLRREEHLIDFLKDPEKAVKVFLSSYSRGQSFWWSDRNLDIMPRVLCFFFRFILKNRVFSGAKDERKYQNALKIAESALQELPLSSVIAKFLLDPFGVDCSKYWGQQRRHSVWSDDEDGDAWSKPEDVNDDDVLAPIQSRTSKATLDESEDKGEETVTSPVSISRPVPEILKTLLSSTNPFPKSHTPGLVEEGSLRRIKQLLPPGAFTSRFTKSYKPMLSDGLIDTVDAVEHDLETKLTKMILIPWPGSAINGCNTPVIPRRPAHLPETPAVNEHDPLEDEITVLISVAKEHLNVLRSAIGMGIVGTWVQLCPIGQEGMNPRRLNFWYMEEQKLVVPSFETC